MGETASKHIKDYDDDPAANAFFPLREQRKSKDSWYISGNTRLKTSYESIENKSSGLWFEKTITGDYVATTKWDHLLELDKNATTLKVSKHGKNAIVINLKKDFIPFPIFYGIISSYGGINFFIYGPEFINTAIKVLEYGCMFKKIRKDEEKYRKYAKTQNYTKICEIEFVSKEALDKVYNSFFLNTEENWDKLLNIKQTYYKCDKTSRKCEITDDMNEYVDEVTCNEDCSKKPWWICKNFEVGCVPAFADEPEAVENEVECNKTCKQTTIEETMYSCDDGVCKPDSNGLIKGIGECMKTCKKEEDEDSAAEQLFKNPIIISVLIGFAIAYIVMMGISYYTNKSLFIGLAVGLVIIVSVSAYYLIKTAVDKVKSSTVGKLIL